MKKKKVIVYECLDFVTEQTTTYDSCSKLCKFEKMDKNKADHNLSRKKLNYHSDGYKMVHRRVVYKYLPA